MSGNAAYVQCHPSLILEKKFLRRICLYAEKNYTASLDKAVAKKWQIITKTVVKEQRLPPV